MSEELNSMNTQAMERGAELTQLMEAPPPDSYPPFTHGPVSSPNQERRREPNYIDDLPLLSLSHLEGGELSRACREYGIFRLAAHGVPPALSAQLFGLARGLLMLPFEIKKAGLGGSLGYLWGTPDGKLPVKETNWVEGLSLAVAQIGAEESGPDPYGLSLFRNVVRQYGAHMAKIVRALFDAVSGELSLDAEKSAEYLAEADGILRLYRYPRCPSWSEIGMAAHSDSSVLTVVNQDSIGGLQILCNGSWLDIAPVPGTLVVIVGDMLQAMSGGKMRSAEHRVLAGSPSGGERMSICYFAFPHEDCVIRCAGGGAYRPFSYGEFRAQVQADLRASGAKVGLKHFEVAPNAHLLGEE